MSDYICKHCKFNNNGWCVELRTNKGLKLKTECSSFKRGKFGDFESKQDTQESYMQLRRLVDKLFYGIGNQWSEKQYGDDIEDFLKELREFMYKDTKGDGGSWDERI